MRHRYLASLGALALALMFVSLATVSMRGQTPAPKAAPAPRPSPAPKMPWGDPDLQGTWFVMEAVPLERSAANANKPLLSDEEVAAADREKAVNPGRNA